MSDKDIKEDIADEAKRIVCGARREAYGTPEQNFDRIAVLWNAYLCLAHGFEQDITPLDVAAMMRLVKEARLIETPDHRDSYVDLVGYALCGAEIALSKDDMS
jgi:hypothetical protein